MIINVDSREHAKVIKPILNCFDEHGIEHISSKLYVADYCLLENPLFLIDRKHNIAEIAQNATSGHARFKRELSRLDKMGAQMVILVEQNKYKGVDDKWHKVEQLEDIMFWQNPHGTVNGFQVFKILNSWRAKHNIGFIFCDKRSTGKMIIELLEEAYDKND